MKRAVFVPFILLLAGCGAPPGPGGEPQPDETSLDPFADTMVWTGCDQWHLHFDARATDFEGEAPPGYTISADDAGLTQLLMHVTLCPEVQEAFLALPVTPPSEHDDPDRLELATLQIFHTGHGPLVYPGPFHSRLVEATFDLNAMPAGPSLTVTGGGETFTVANILNPSTGTFAGERWARIAHDGDAYGILNADGNESTNVGFGPVTYTHQGSGGAPPATAGITHIVTGLDIHLTKEITT